MTRMDFLKQLEYLLQDIDEKDREVPWNITETIWMRPVFLSLLP